MRLLPLKGLPFLISRIVVVILIVVVYAYGLEVTRVDLEKPQEAKRQEQLSNILRGLAHPDVIEYDINRLQIEAPILTPCVGAAPTAPAPLSGQPALVLSTYCAEPGSKITVSGVGFRPGDEVFLYFVPYAANTTEQVELKLTPTSIFVEADGTFTREVELKKDRPADKPQIIRAVINRQTSAPRPSQALIDTFNKIIETAFLAFIATTIGIIFAIPISFMAARNLMFQVTSTFAKFMAALVALPIGGYLGFVAFQYLTTWGQQLAGAKPELAGAAWLWAILPFVGLAAVVSADRKTSTGWLAKLRRVAILVIATAVIVIGAAALTSVGRATGLSLKESLKDFTFVGNFLLIFSDVVLLGLAPLGALSGMAVFSQLADREIEKVALRAPKSVYKVSTIILAIGGGAILFSLIMVVINWFYELGPWTQVVIWPGLIGAAILGTIAIVVSPDKTMPTGMYIYYIVRTIMNTFRSIEPLVLVVAFAVWVGIGPFAGVMALGLHTIVGLGKLYSEQVESIATGPIEAITATGANRLQTIIYAVIPQIVPPYIAFTLYRWDINVRMSTIIGFGGGGGIGFLLSQNINLLKYRQASVNMLAIAIVVAALDYASAKVREKIT